MEDRIEPHHSNLDQVCLDLLGPSHPELPLHFGRGPVRESTFSASKASDNPILRGQALQRLPFLFKEVLDLGESSVKTIDIRLGGGRSDEIRAALSLFEVIDFLAQGVFAHAETNSEIDLFGNVSVIQANPAGGLSVDISIWVLEYPHELRVTRQMGKNTHLGLGIVRFDEYMTSSGHKEISMVTTHVLESWISGENAGSS